MLNLQSPIPAFWRPRFGYKEAGDLLFRGLTQVLSSPGPLDLDPEQSLLNPGPEDGYEARSVNIPIGFHETSGTFFLPRRASGSTLCLVHGTTVEKVGPYYKWIRAFLDAGIQVLAFELDGHGRNPRPLCAPGLESDVPAALAFLRAQPEVDPDRLGLLGVSLGGACVLNAAPDEAGLKAIATVATPHHVNMDEWNKICEAAGVLSLENLATCLEATPNHLLDFFTRPIHIASGLEGPQQDVDLLHKDMIPAINRMFRHLNPLDNAARLGDLPLLVVGGDWDNVAPAWQAKEIYSVATGPKALALIPRRNHFTIIVSPLAVETSVNWFRRWL